MLWLTEAADGRYRLTSQKPEFARQMSLAEDIMQQIDRAGVVPSEQLSPAWLWRRAALTWWITSERSEI